MRKKRIMVVGPTRSGKTTIVNFLNEYDGPLRRIPDLIYGKKTMDVPGAYLENPWMYKHIISISQDASHVLILCDQSHSNDCYPFGFAKAFTCPVIGVITKCDLMPENEEKCLRKLKEIGVDEPYFKVSFSDGRGVDELKNYLLENKE